jgi:hypothetical protein
MPAPAENGVPLIHFGLTIVPCYALVLLFSLTNDDGIFFSINLDRPSFASSMAIIPICSLAHDLGQTRIRFLPFRYSMLLNQWPRLQ